MVKIKSVEARQILDSRDQPTLEVKVITNEGVMVADSLPSGVSTGSNEAVILDAKKAIDNINNIIAPKIIGTNPVEQEVVDRIMTDLDGTKNHSRLGANAILGVSLAVSRAGAMSQQKPLYWHINSLYSHILGHGVEPSIPEPMMVMIEGGKHGKNNVCIQEFLCIGTIDNGKSIWNRLKKILKDNNLDTSLGLEGGFAPTLEYDEDALRFIMQAIAEENLSIPKDIKIGLDVAANNCEISNDDIITMARRYPIYLLEDPVPENKWAHWAQLKLELDALQRDYLLLGDDLFVTDFDRLKKGINNLVANGIVIKINQAATLTEILNIIAEANKANYTHIVSHRAGETSDTYISDLAVGTAAKFIKSGAPFASERIIKYNRLKEIESEL